VTDPDRSEVRVPDHEIEFDSELVYRWKGAKFTGIAYERSEDGVVSEVRFLDGVQEGTSRDISATGSVLAEANYRNNALHGWSRDYGEDGAVAREAYFEYGILVRSAEYDDSGDAVASFEIDPTGNTYALLQRLRRDRDGAPEQ
jgi:antitoxin component YwqK of YwqJK toxin-antitoxin module